MKDDEIRATIKEHLRPAMEAVFGPPTIDVVKKLNELDGDEEASHIRADNLLLEYLDATGANAVADAWRRAKDRITFWYS